jgi:hypothetical protein
MTAKEYKEQRAYWLNAAKSLNKRIFPRCFRARLREIVKLDAEHDKREYEEVRKEIYQEFISDARQ